MGNLSDRRGRKLVSIISLSSLAAFAFIITLLSSPALLLVASVLNGLTITVFGTVAAYIGDHSEPRDVDRRMSINMASQGVGFAIGPILGGFLAQNYGFHFGYYVASAFAVAALAAAVYGIKGGGSINVVQRRIMANGRQALSNPTVLSVCILSVFSAFAFGCIYTFLPLRGQAIGLGDAEIGTILGVRTAMSAVSRLPMGYLSDRIGKVRLLSLGIILPAIAGVLIPLTSSFALLTLIVCLEGMGYGFFQTASRAMTAVTSEGHLRGMTMALLDIFGSVGYGFLVLGVGFGADLFGLPFAFYLMSLILVVGGIFPIRMLQRALRNKPA
jgi:MFS family permease